MRESRSAARYRRARGILRRFGIRATPYHLVLERLPDGATAELDRLPPGFTCLPFGEVELEEIVALEARRGHVDPEVIRARAGADVGCLGLKHDGVIVAFSWYAVGTVDSPYMPTRLAPNEAYLFDMWVAPEYRGRKLAPILRYRTYRHLADAGVDTCFSVTQLGNDASARFKAKLGAELVHLGVAFDIRGRWRGRATLWRFGPRGPTTPPPVPGD